MLTLRRVDFDRCDRRLDERRARLVFQTQDWLRFLERTQGGEPVVAAVERDGEVVGWFTGMVVRRFGVRILGSPFPGWTTGSMGFDLDRGVSRSEAVEALVRFAFGDLRCLHLELKDRSLAAGDVAGIGFETRWTTTFDVDLTADEETIFGRMTSACRRNVRQAERKGVVVEEVQGDSSFAEEYHAQLVDVFAKQSLPVPYGADRVRALIECLGERVLLLRARGPDGEQAATGIFPGCGASAYFWGGASFREHQWLRPNEAIFWHAMREWKQRGAEVLDLGGGGEYKRKYGAVEVCVPFFRRSRHRVLGRARDVAEQLQLRARR